MTRAPRFTAVPRGEVTGHAALLFPSTNGEQILNNHHGLDLPGDAAARDDALALARDLKHGAVMQEWDWDGWFINIVNEQGP
jgi:hypothetical protein